MPSEKEAPVYTAERILDKRIVHGKIEYLLKWKGWTSKWNTWEPEKHILDKLLIEDYDARQKKTVRRSSTAIKDRTTAKSRASIITRRLRSSSSSITSTTPAVDLDDDEKSSTNNTKSSGGNLKELNRALAYGLRPTRTQKYLPEPMRASISSNESDVEKDVQDSAMEMNPPNLDESLRDFLWQPNKLSSESTISTTITEVTDNNGVTVLIRELKESPLPTTVSRTPRFLGYGNGGRGGHH